VSSLSKANYDSINNGNTNSCTKLSMTLIKLGSSGHPMQCIWKSGKTGKTKGENRGGARGKTRGAKAGEQSVNENMTPGRTFMMR